MPSRRGNETAVPPDRRAARGVRPPVLVSLAVVAVVAVALQLVLAGAAHAGGAVVPARYPADDAVGSGPATTTTTAPAATAKATKRPRPTGGQPSGGVAPELVLRERLMQLLGRQAEPAPSHQFRVASANLYVAMSWPRARADLVRLTRDADIVGLNEVSRGRAAAIRAWAAGEPDWWFYSPTSPDNEWQGMNAVLVRTSVFAVLEQGVLYGSPASMPGYRISSRWITWARLRHRESGVVVTHLQTHMDAAVEARGRPRPVARQRVSNNAAYMEVLRIAARALAQGGEVVIGGDWNVDARADRQTRFGQFPFSLLEDSGDDAALPGIRSTYSELGLPGTATRSGRYIDYLAVWKRAEPERRVLTAVDHEVLTGVNSDHNPILATLQLDPAGGDRVSR